MATRSGTVDPGLVLWLEEHEHLSPHEIADRAGAPLRTHRAGRHRRHARDPGCSRIAETPNAALALDVYIHRLAGGIAAMSAAAGGLDVLAFTGGVGEHSSQVRARAADRLGFLGVAIDAHRNQSAHGDDDITGGRRSRADPRGHRQRGPANRTRGPLPCRRAWIAHRPDRRTTRCLTSALDLQAVQLDGSVG